MVEEGISEIENVLKSSQNTEYGETYNTKSYVIM